MAFGHLRKLLPYDLEGQSFLSISWIVITRSFRGITQQATRSGTSSTCTSDLSPSARASAPVIDWDVPGNSTAIAISCRVDASDFGESLQGRKGCAASPMSIARPSVHSSTRGRFGWNQDLMSASPAALNSSVNGELIEPNSERSASFNPFSESSASGKLVVPVSHTQPLDLKSTLTRYALYRKCCVYKNGAWLDRIKFEFDVRPQPFLIVSGLGAESLHNLIILTSIHA